MATPVNTLVFRKIFGRPGSYGDQAREISRPGVDGHEWLIIGKRGSRTTLEAVSFHLDRATAFVAIRAAETSQGREVLIRSAIDGRLHQVFLHSIEAQEPRIIGGVGLGLNTYVIKWRIDVTRTA